MALTREQDRAVRTVDRDLCVVAGAGSGKTSVLTERFVHLALDRGAALDRILTLTFTDRAAVEMRERVARRFGERGRHDLRRETASAWIGTFHSFCARLLKENAIEAGVDPSFTVLAEAGAETLLDRALEAAVDRLREEAPESLAPLALLSTTREGLEADLGRLLDRCRGLDGDPAAALAAEAAPPDPAAGLAALRRALGDLRDGLDSYRDAGWKRATAVLEAARGLDGIDPGDAAALGAAAGAVVASVNLQCGAPAKERLRAAKAAGEALLGDLVALRAAPVAASLATLLSALDAAYAAERAARGAMDFHDLERRALDLLRDDPGVREEVRARFDHLLVDEFQDTNPVQEALLGLLRTPRRTFVVGDPKQAIYGFRGADHGGFARALEAAGEGGTVRLRENFRSRPEILSFAGAVLEPAFAAGAPVQVPWQPLLPGASFGPKGIPSVEVHLVEGEEPTGALREREARMLAGRLHSLVEGRAASITARTPGGDPGGRPLRWGDAAVLLRALTDLKVYERAFAERDIPFQVVGGRGFFEAREVVDLANLLEAVDNPRHELALAAALRSPFGGLDDDALLALAEERRRRDGTMADLLLEGRVRAPGLSPEGRARASAFAEVFRDLRALRGRGRLVEIVDRAVAGTGYDLAALLRRDGRRKAANLRKVREQARLFEADGSGGLREFVEAVRRLRLRETRETEAPLESEDAVSILTVHQAKGLEWPLVLVPDVARVPPAVKEPILVEEGRAALSLRSADGPLRTPGWRALAEGRKARDGAESLRVFHVAVTRAREHLVLSAVRGKRGAGPWWKAVAGALGDAEFPAGGEPAEAPLPGDPSARILLGRALPGPAGRGPRPVALLERHRRRFLAGRGLRVRLPAGERAAVAAAAALPPPAPAPDETPYLATVSALLDFEADPRRWWLRHRVGAPDRSPPLPSEGAAAPADLARGSALDRTDGAPPPPEGELPPRREGRPGDEDEVHDGIGATGIHGVPRWISGVAVHAVLGTMDLLRDGEAEVRAAARMRLREEMEEAPPEAAVEEVAGWVARFRASPAGRSVAEAAARGALHRELPFLMKRRGILLRGQVDLLWRDGEGRWTVADYKASAEPRDRRKRARYARQIAIYALALRGIAPGAAGSLLYLDGEAPAAVAVPVEGEARSLDRLLDRFAAAAARPGRPKR